jgi:hypothetical protein
MDKITGEINYQYQILRYRHDAVSGEFVNIGIVFFDADSRFLCARITEKQERIARFFGSASSAFLLSTTKHIENEFNQIAERLADAQTIIMREALSGHVIDPLLMCRSITEITSSVLPINDNGLFFSEVHKGWHYDHQNAFNETYYRLIGKYNGEKIEETRPISKTMQEQPQLVLV